MQSQPLRLRLVLLALAVVIGGMLVVGSAVALLYPDEWRRVEATVQGAHIESTRPGTLQWALRVDSTYEVDGKTYETASDVFHDSEYSVTETQLGKWPAGRKFTLYYEAGNPKSASLIADGGREATTVMAVLLTPLALIVIAFSVLLARRLRANARQAP
jgi:Protein of unknown function (DUF3592)